MIKICTYAAVPRNFFEARRFSDDDVSQTVRLILDDVRAKGDLAVRDYSKRFDRAAPKVFEIDKSDATDAALALKNKNAALYDALCYSRDLAFRFAQEQRKCFFDFETELVSGVFTGQKVLPVARAGVYVPGGRYPLLSSVIMGVMPAKAAGVGEVIFCSPPYVYPDSTTPDKPYIDSGILAAAALCGADRFFAAGGAQAIGAMAYGTQQIPRADVIVGPGNKYVAEAKRQVYGEAGIDLIAGPTEVLIIADESAHSDWIAADMLAQAEHDADAQSILVTSSHKLAEAVCRELESQLSILETATTARESLENHGLIILVETLEQAVEIANKKAPEHLELALADGENRTAVERAVHNYGSLFVGHRAAEVLGDYAAGLNHTLPTSGAARFTGGLSVRHFLKTVTVLRTAEKGKAADSAQSGFADCARAADELGRAEGLYGHAAAARKRL